MNGNPKNSPDPAQPSAPVDEQDTSTPAQGSDTAPEDTSTTSPWIKPKTA
jgi:hypothetical protein